MKNDLKNTKCVFSLSFCYHQYLNVSIKEVVYIINTNEHWFCFVSVNEWMNKKNKTKRCDVCLYSKQKTFVQTFFLEKCRKEWNFVQYIKLNTRIINIIETIGYVGTITVTFYNFQFFVYAYLAIKISQSTISGKKRKKILIVPRSC